MYKKLANIPMQLPLLFFACTMTITSLQSMNRFDEIMEIVILNADHHEQRVFAVLNKTYNKIIEDRYRQKKKCIELLMKEKDTPLIQGQVSWNKDFNRCASAIITSKSDKALEKNLELTLVGLEKKENKDIVIDIHQTFDNFYFPVIEDEKRPFFDKNGAACFYGYAKVPTSVFFGCLKKTDHVVRFSINLDNQIKRQRCLFKVGEFTEEFCHIFDFPILLKSFLQSAHMDEKEKENSVDVSLRIYHLEGVHFPENYKFFKKHIEAEEYLALFRAGANSEDSEQDNDIISSYNELTDGFKEAVDKRYEVQQQEVMKIEEK